jgi:hypothetical protein
MLSKPLAALLRDDTGAPVSLLKDDTGGRRCRSCRMMM